MFITGFFLYQTPISALCLFNFLRYRIATTEGYGDFILTDGIYLRKYSAQKIIVKFRQRLEVFQEFPCRFFTEKISAVVVLLLSQFFKLTGIFAFLTIEVFQFIAHMLKCTAADGSKDLPFCGYMNSFVRQVQISFHVLPFRQLYGLLSFARFLLSSFLFLRWL